MTAARKTVSLRERTSGTSEKRAALAALYETHFERVSRYISVRIGDFSEAEDLASEVFIRAVRAADTYHDRGAPLEAWVFKIAHNIVVDHLRKKSRRPASHPIDEAFSLAGPQDPQKDVEKKQEAEFLHRALKQLSDAHQQVLALRFGAEMTSEEAAQVLGKKPGAVREMQSAAIKKLRQVISVAAGAQA